LSLLLDTHALIWWLNEEPKLSRAAQVAIADIRTVVFVSAASVWEVSIKQSRGKLNAPSDLVHQIEANRFEPLPITVAHAYAAGSLPRHHNDPFDRMLVAQALAEGLTIVTRDERIARYGVPTLAA
jgi:PIN domain nuclease of toxin-antitoxin system